MNERIKTSIGGSALVMRVAAIASLVVQGLSLVAGAAMAGKVDNIVGTIISVMLAVFLLQGANAQESYAKGGKEIELLEGLKKETTYWQVTAILATIVAVILGLVILAFLIWGQEIIRALERENIF